MAKTLKLLVASYDQPQSRERDTDYTPRRRGEVFDAIDQAEYDRLTSIGAALDPDEAQKQEYARLEAERTRLEAQRADIDAQLAAKSDPSELKGKELDDALSSRGLSTEGKADEKRARLAEAVAAESQ